MFISQVSFSTAYLPYAAVPVRLVSPSLFFFFSPLSAIKSSRTQAQNKNATSDQHAHHRVAVVDKGTFIICAPAYCSDGFTAYRLWCRTNSRMNLVQFVLFCSSSQEMIGLQTTWACPKCPGQDICRIVEQPACARHPLGRKAALRCAPLQPWSLNWPLVGRGHGSASVWTSQLTTGCRNRRSGKRIPIH